MELIGGKLLTLAKVKEEFKESKRELTREELRLLLDEAWADIGLTAFVLGMSSARVRKWIKKGELKASKLMGQWWIEMAQFDKIFGLEKIAQFRTRAETKAIPPHIRRLRVDYLRDLKAGRVDPIIIGPSDLRGWGVPKATEPGAEPEEGEGTERA